MTVKLTETNHVVYVLKPGDHQAGAVGDSFKLVDGHAAFVVQFAALTGDAVLTVSKGATAGTKTTALSFRYRLASGVQAAANADVFGAWATSDALTLTAATYANKTLVVEVDASQAAEGGPWVTFDFSSAASALNASVVAVLSTIRYASLTPTTII